MLNDNYDKSQIVKNYDKASNSFVSEKGYLTLWLL